ncbi:MAG TPA: hypothetical protein VFD03_11320 [Clostridia bacterium]|nr:hypothetical protein [Clostridia bacterium]
MAKAKVIVDYSTNRYSDSDLTKRASGIISGLTDNPKFQELAEVVPVIKTKMTTLSPY